jgi:hypothetical protein
MRILRNLKGIRGVVNPFQYPLLKSVKTENTLSGNETIEDHSNDIYIYTDHSKH